MSEPKKEHVATSWPGRYKSTIQQVCVAIEQSDVYAHLHTGLKRRRCGPCKGCNSDDCGTYIYYQDKPKFGGSGKRSNAVSRESALKCKTTR